MKLCSFIVFILVLFVHDVLCQRFTPCKTPTIKHGWLRSKQRGRYIRYMCEPGYLLAGEKTGYCRNGAWDAPIPKCVRPNCRKQDIAPFNGSILPSYGGAVLQFYCHMGFQLNGPDAVYCDGNTWDNHRPSCISSNTKPKLFCDFEDADLCHWTHDLNHDMDWVRDSYKTPTGYSMPTGPSFDHTKGNGSNGHYMYLETSSRRINDTARLVSPVFEKMDNSSNTCLEFWYHMYGKTTGTLRAYMRKTSDPLWPLNPERALFSKSGNQGDVWYREFIDLGVISDEFQIVMEGVRGNGYVSDMAIDDIKIIPNCVYEDHMQTTTEFVSLVSEDLKTVESCQNRCGEKSFGNETSDVIACDCDESCYGRCCPDFIDICLSGVSTDQADEYNKATTESYIPLVLHTVTRHSTAYPQYSNTNTSPNHLKPLTEKTEIHPKKVNFTVPPLIILRAPTTPQIVQKLLPTHPTPPSKISFVKPKTSTISFYHDDLGVPTSRLNKDDELLLLSTRLPIDDDSNDINEDSVQEKEDYVEKISIDKDYHIKINYDDPKHIGEYKTEYRQTLDENDSGNLTFVAIATVCGIALVGILAAVVLVKFRFISFKEKKMRSGQGNSQSDVRFLTAGEVLDFNIDNDYEEL